MTLGKPGMPGNAEGFFSGASSVVVAPNGDIFVGDGHGGNTNDRVVKFDKTGKQIATWGKHGKGQGEFDQLHGIAMDSQGQIFVADRGNSRIQIFDSNGKFVAEWKQFGRPSDVAIDKNDVIYVSDDQSNQNNNPGFKTGIRIGSAKDGKVTAFIPTPNAEIATPEGVGFDDAGNVYGSWTGKMAVRRWTKN
jgi:sugar lactone lactonase YvrE